MSITAAKVTLLGRLAVIVPDTLRIAKNGQPMGVQDYPLGYLESRDGSRQRTAGPTIAIYRIALVLLVRLQDAEHAEQQIDTLIDVVSAAVESFTVDGKRGFVGSIDWNADHDEEMGANIRKLTLIIRVKQDIQPA